MNVKAVTLLQLSLSGGRHCGYRAGIPFSASSGRNQGADSVLNGCFSRLPRLLAEKSINVFVGDLGEGGFEIRALLLLHFDFPQNGVENFS